MVTVVTMQNVDDDIPQSFFYGFPERALFYILVTLRRRQRVWDLEEGCAGVHSSDGHTYSWLCWCKIVQLLVRSKISTVLESVKKYTGSYWILTHPGK